MTLTRSYQLPDLLALTRPLELRTNQHCRTVSTTTEKWAIAQDHWLTSAELESLAAKKIGVLASLCLPCTDLMQLELVTQLLMILIHSDLRLTRGYTLNWSTTDDASTPHLPVDGLEILMQNEVFLPIKHQLSRFIAKAPQNWHERFAQSVLRFRAAQIEITRNHSLHKTPNLESYTELRRDARGLSILFDLMQIAQGLSLPSDSDDTETTSSLKKLETHAQNIITWSLDIASYNIDQSLGNTHNIVDVLMTHDKSLSTIQAAITHAAKLVEQEFAAFLKVEESILSPAPETHFTKHGHLKRPLSILMPSSWFNHHERKSSSSSNEHADIAPSSPAVDEDVRVYLHGLRDCVVGFVNWAYETDIYFGAKGEEVRWFRWVFVIPKEVEMVPRGMAVAA